MTTTDRIEILERQNQLLLRCTYLLLVLRLDQIDFGGGDMWTGDPDLHPLDVKAKLAELIDDVLPEVQP